MCLASCRACWAHPATTKESHAHPLQDPTAIASLIAREQPHVLCLQEIKLQTSHCDEELHDLLALGPEWQITWNCSTAKKGYSGTAILTRSSGSLLVECTAMVG